MPPALTACTVATRSRLAHARVMTESFLRLHPEGRMVALVVDDLGHEVGGEPFDVIRPEELELDPDELLRMAAIYDALALSCALKPWLLSHLVRDDAVLYLDTDIEVLGPLDRLAELAHTHSLMLTPHLMHPQARFESSEWNISLAGTFNAGCLALTSGARPFLAWWSERVSRHCLRATDIGFFHDQRWLDLVPGYFPYVALDDRTYHIGFGEPQGELLDEVDGRYFVDGRPLHSFHFGGLLDPETPWRPYPWVELRDPSWAVSKLTRDYSAALLEHGYRACRRTPYGFGCDSDGVELTDEVRRTYREALLRFELDGEAEPPNPLVQSVDAFLGWLREPPAPIQAPPAATARTIVALEGPFALRFGMANVNRGLGAALAASGAIELDVIATEASQLSARFADVHVRHEWPPRFVAPDAGRWVLMQPWEFGSPPKDWLEPIQELVDEVWVPTSYVRDCYVAGGVDAAKIAVVPHGVDPQRFRSGLEPLPLPTQKTFRFLFVGGTLYRKGADILLETYLREFDPADDVCLVIKDFGVESFYRGQGLRERILEAQLDPSAPEIVYYDHDFDELELPRLYASCDALVHPYRGEGFALPVAEAMACGLHVIVTGIGACVDYCDASVATLVPARAVEHPPAVGELETTGPVRFAEVDRDALAAAMRCAAAAPQHGRKLGRRASKRIHDEWTWARAASAAEDRVRALTSRRRELSVCMIVRNEEALLGRALESVREIADELIVVDTGSTDSTVEIARSFGAEVFSHPWEDDFAAARNESLRHATKDWILVVDGDQELDPSSHAELRRLTRSCAPRGYLVRQLNHLERETGLDVYEHLTLRLFRNHPGVRFAGRVHEQLVCDRANLNFELHAADVVLHHHGYRPAFVDPVTLDRDCAALEEMVRDDPSDPFHVYNLGMTYQALGRTQEAERELLRAIALCAPTMAHGTYPHYIVGAYLAVAQSQLERGLPGDAAAACEAALKLRPDAPDVRTTHAVALAQLGRLDDARSAFERAIACADATAFSPTDRAAGGWRSLLGLADVLFRLGLVDEAAARLEQAAAAAPANPLVAAARDRLYAELGSTIR